MIRRFPAASLAAVAVALGVIALLLGAASDPDECTTSAGDTTAMVLALASFASAAVAFVAAIWIAFRRRAAALASSASALLLAVAAGVVDYYAILSTVDFCIGFSML
jgi:hypothetical protein